MPFIQVKTNQNIADSKSIIKSELGSAITAIPGKSEGWLMVEISDKLDMYFKAVTSRVRCSRLQYTAKQAITHMTI